MNYNCIGEKNSHDYHALAAIFLRRYFNYSMNRVARFYKLGLVKQTEVVCTPTRWKL